MIHLRFAKFWNSYQGHCCHLQISFTFLILFELFPVLMTFKHPTIFPCVFWNFLRQYNFLVLHEQNSQSSFLFNHTTKAFLPLSPECNTNCHRKCQGKMPPLCGINQKLLAEALDQVRVTQAKKSVTDTSRSRDGDGVRNFLFCCLLLWILLYVLCFLYLLLLFIFCLFVVLLFCFCIFFCLFCL